MGRRYMNSDENIECNTRMFWFWVVMGKASAWGLGLGTLAGLVLVLVNLQGVSPFPWVRVMGTAQFLMVLGASMVVSAPVGLVWWTGKYLCTSDSFYEPYEVDRL